VESKWYLPAVELWKTNVAGISALSLIPELLYDNNDADHQRNDFLNFCGAEGTAPSSLMRTVFSLK